MSLLFNMLSRLVITFLPRSKHLLISWLQLPSSVILELKKIKSVTVSIVSPSICYEVMGPDAMILVFWVLSFKPTSSLSSFTFIKRLFSASSLSAVRVMPSAYLRLLIFLLGILIPVCASSRQWLPFNKTEPHHFQWIFIGRTDAVAEGPMLWPPDGKNWLLGKDPDAGKDWRQKEKGTTEDDHQLDAHESEQALGVSDGQGNLACYSPWESKKSDTTEWLNWTELHSYPTSCP